MSAVEEFPKGLNQVQECLDDCYCKSLCFEQVVPYVDEEGCPSDEKLFENWAHYRCKTCFDWWYYRVVLDPRYKEVFYVVQTKVPQVDLEEASQNVMRTMLKKTKSIDHVIAYFCAALKLSALNLVRKNRKVEVLYFDPSIFDVMKSRQSVVDRNEDLGDCLARLSDKAQGLTNAIYYEGSTVSEQAVLLNKSIGALHKMLSRIRLILRECIDKKVGTV